jgi:hypothetical protein
MRADADLDAAAASLAEKASAAAPQSNARPAASD